jgi:hypothetical protein
VLTLFTTAKPFAGPIATLQRNALKSWALLHPDVEIILFGDDEGAAEVSAELGIRHEPHVLRNDHGSKRIDYIFDRAHEIARHDILCYVNCDIVCWTISSSQSHECRLATGSSSWWAAVGIPK